MRYALQFSVLCLLVLAATSANATITLVQHTNKDAAAATSTTLAFASATTAGNCIIVTARVGGNTTFSVTDDHAGGSNTYTTAVSLNNGTVGTTYIIRSCGAGSAQTLTFQPGTSQTMRIAIYEYSGVASSSELDVTNNGTGTGTSATAGTGITPIANNELIIGVVAVDNTGTFTAGSNFTQEDAVPAAPNTKQATQDWVQTSGPTATTAPQTISQSVNWTDLVAAFKPSAAGGAPANQFPRVF